MVNVGLVTGTATPSARSAPRTNVVLPAPSSPETSTTSPGRRLAASSAPARSVASGPSVIARAQASPQRDAAQEQPEAGDGRRDGIAAGARELLRRRCGLRGRGRGGGGGRGAGGGGRRRGLGGRVRAAGRR